VVDKYFSKHVLRNKKLTLALLPLGWIFTQSAVFFAWIFFRNPDLSDAIHLLNSILNRTSGVFETSDALLVCSVLILSFSLDLTEKVYKGVRKNYSDLLIGMSIGGLLLVSAILRSSEIVPFIYFRF
jgi:hypothetical protein